MCEYGVTKMPNEVQKHLCKITPNKMCGAPNLMKDLVRFFHEQTMNGNNYFDMQETFSYL